MEKSSRVNLFTKNQVANNFFIELPIENIDNQNSGHNWMEKLLDLSSNEEMLSACELSSSKDFLSILFKNNVLTVSDKENNSSKIVMGETSVYVNVDAIVDVEAVTDAVGVAEGFAVIVAIAIGDMLNEFELRNERYKAITRFASKNGSLEFAKEISSIFKQLEAGKPVLL